MATSATVKACIWVRVSTVAQDTENQVRELRLWADRRGIEIVRIYEVEASAWKGRQRAALDQVIADARGGAFTVLLCWALDRLSREGPLATLLLVDRLARTGVEVWSLQ